MKFITFISFEAKKLAFEPSKSTLPCSNSTILSAQLLANSRLLVTKIMLLFSFESALPTRQYISKIFFIFFHFFPLTCCDFYRSFCKKVSRYPKNIFKTATHKTHKIKLIQKHKASFGIQKI